MWLALLAPDRAGDLRLGSEDSLDWVRSRVARRNQDLPPGTFHFSVEELAEWVPRFERPAEEELPQD
jgi:hypothetical protein